MTTNLTVILLSSCVLMPLLLCLLGCSVELLSLLNETRDLVYEITDYGFDVLKAVKAGNVTIIEVKEKTISSKINYIYAKLTEILNNIHNNITKILVESIEKNETILILRKGYEHLINDMDKYDTVIILNNDEFNSLCMFLGIEDNNVYGIIVTSKNNITVLSQES